MMIGVPSGLKVTDTELDTTAVTARLPAALGLGLADGPEDANSNTNARACGIINAGQYFPSVFKRLCSGPALED